MLNSNELLPLVVQNNSVLVDALLLHKKVGSKTRFNDWISYRCREYGFEENKDYFTEKVSKSITKPIKNYLLTLDMAKELAMLEKNEIGRNIRRYFIAKEKELRSISQLPKETQLFKGLKPRRVNDRMLYPYVEVLQRAGYSTKSSSSQRRAKYWMHFVKEGSKLYITNELALHLYHQKQVYNNRQALKEMQPVLPMNFGDTTYLKGGSHVHN